MYNNKKLQMKAAKVRGRKVTNRRVIPPIFKKIFYYVTYGCETLDCI